MTPFFNYVMGRHEESSSLYITPLLIEEDSSLSLRMRAFYELVKMQQSHSAKAKWLC